MSRLLLSQNMWDALTTHLLRDNSEHFAFVLAEATGTGAGTTLLGRDLILVPDSALEADWEQHGVSLRLDALLAAMNRANQLRCVLVEAHSHPFSRNYVDFSPIDLEGQRQIVVYLGEVMPDRPYGAFVLGKNAAKGQLWLPGKPTPEIFTEIRVVGPALISYRNDSFGLRPSEDRDSTDVETTYERQVLLLGREGQRKIQGTKVAVVGLGGIGSVVCQQLTYLGVSDFLFIDCDVVEPTNLHRLVTASNGDIGRLKVEAARETIRKQNAAVTVTTLGVDVRDPRALEALTERDVIFGCVDTDYGRLILNELCNAYLVPYIDCGVGITAENGRIVEAGGRVIVWVPGRPCLVCANEINPRIAAEELESEREREFRRRYGYVAGAQVREPAVISLNGTVASIAVTQFIGLVTGVWSASYYTYYDLLEQRLGPRIVKKDERCTACSVTALGDKANIIRYSRVDLPADLPRTR